MRMLMCPWGSSLLLGNSNGGLRRLQISSEDGRGGKPKLVEVSAAFREAMSGLSSEVGTMAFNAPGTLLGLGFKEGGGVVVAAYPSMRPLVQWTLDDPEVKDLDFCPLPGAAAAAAGGAAAAQQAAQQAGVGQQAQQAPRAELLATVGGDGNCTVWLVALDAAQPERVQRLAQLPPPKGVAKCRFIRCRWARRSGGGLVLFALINVGRDSSLLAAYGPPDAPGQPWALLKKVKAKDQPASAMDISRSGEWIAAGFADGYLRVFSAASLALRSEAEASIAFVSSVTFNAAGDAAIAVGGDANCYVMDLAPRGGGGPSWLLVALGLLLFVAALVVQHFWAHPEQLPFAWLQWLQAAAKPEQQLGQACAAGGFPAHGPVCEWVQRAAAILPDEATWGAHDEL
ncbi:hypothetical protein HT031_006083 [Scenedesmus sp. PABB004]|nr:hypothetical protein HT031_006083 [Scenedesmus sp. PABB004]